MPTVLTNISGRYSYPLVYNKRIFFPPNRAEISLGVRLSHGGRGSNGITADRTTAARRAELGHESHSLRMKWSSSVCPEGGKTLEMTRKWGEKNRTVAKNITILIRHIQFVRTIIEINMRPKLSLRDLPS